MALPPDTALQGHRCLRRRFYLLLPAAFITYSLAFLDRTNFGLGAAAGLAQTLHISGSQLSLLSALFFLGYFLFQVPGAMLARRVGIGRLIFCSVFCWGVLASLTGVVRHFWLLALIRFFLGVSECVVFPVMLLLLTQWFTRGERSRSNSLLIMGSPVTTFWMSALTGFLIDRLGWQRTFIWEGLPAVVWAFAWLALIRDRPREAGWLTPEAISALEGELAREQRALASPPGSSTSRRAVLLRPDVLLLALQYFCWSLGVYGFILWLPTIVRQASSLGSALPRSMTSTGLLTAIPYAFAVVCMLVLSYASDRTGKRAQWIWPSLVIGGSALFASFLLSGHSFRLAFACLILAEAGMQGPFGPFFALVAERVGSHAVGEAMALINSCGALGAFFGSYLVGWLQTTTGGPKAGFLLMSAAVLLAALLLVLLPAPRHAPVPQTSLPEPA